MGVDNLKQLCKGKYKTSPIKESIIHHSNISQFYSKKVAIDISSYIYKYKVVYGEKWLNSISMFIITLKKAGVHGIFCFDGKPPIEKEKEGLRRKEQSQKLEDKLFNIYVDIDIYKRVGEVTPLLIDTMKSINKKDCNSDKKRMLHTTTSKPEENSYIDVKLIEQFVSDKESQIVKISKEDIVLIKDLITLYGGKYFQSPSEAEALCAFLYYIGEVEAVITEDTDILVYGVETFISGVNSVTGECEIILLSQILELVELSMESFVDFCIMCGTDYGGTVKGVGIVSSLKFIKKYENIITWAIDTENDILIYNYTNSKELFNTFGRILSSFKREKEKDEVEKNKKLFKTLFWETTIDFDKLFYFLSSNKCFYSESNIREIWDGVQITFEK